MYRLFASGRSVAASRVANNLPKNNSKALLQSASNILDNAFSRVLSNGFGQSRRMLVTQQTYKSLQEAIPRKINVSKFSPYQRYGLCADQAINILRARLAEARQADSASLIALLWGKACDQVKEAMVGAGRLHQKLFTNNELPKRLFTLGGNRYCLAFLCERCRQDKSKVYRCCFQR